MIKRTLTLIFILFTNIVLLAHAVIPHHHHVDEICIEDSNCQSTCDDHEQEDETQNHDHEDTSTNDQCILKQAFIIPTNQLKPDFRVVDNNDELYILNLSIALDNQEIISSNLISTFRAHPFYKTKLTDCYPGNSHSLRAPPTI